MYWTSRKQTTEDVNNCPAGVFLPGQTIRRCAGRGYRLGAVFHRGSGCLRRLVLIRSQTTSISVSVDELDRWEEDWIEAHEPHAPDDEEWESTAEDEDSGPRLRTCCGESRPKGPPPLLVTASTEPYITVHDFIAAVHPWISQFEDYIRRMLGVIECESLPSYIDLFVHFHGLSPLMINAPRLYDGPAEYFEKRWSAVASRARKCRDSLL